MKTKPVTYINPKKVNLSPDQFKEWFEKNHDGDWKKAYKEIGGKLDKKKAVVIEANQEPSE